MTDSPTAAIVVAAVRPCEQYRFRVELPRTLDRKVRADIRRRALQEVNDCFLYCTRIYQAMAWLGASNLSFADSRHSPSDSKSEFLHKLICLKIIDLSYLYHLENSPAGEPPQFAVEVEVTLSSSNRKAVMKLCEERGMELVRKPDIVAKTRGRARIGGAYRSSQHGGVSFALQPIRYMESLRGVVTRRLPTLLGIRRCVNIIFRAWILLMWPIPIAARAIFSFYYRAAAARILKRLDGPANVFIYFDLRLGRNRDIGAYMRWKYGTAFSSAADSGSSCIPFTHIARPAHAYSFGAMVWAYQVLKRMEKDPLSGCVVVNYLIPTVRLLEVNFLRGDQRRKVRRKLVELERNAGDIFQQAMFKEFIASLDLNHGFPVEVSTCYDTFFGALAPGVVVQADAVAKTARHFTASARRHGSRVVYVADRICTSLRTSNQFITDDGDNPHLPSRCVVFDQVSKDEFVRQGMAAEDIHSYDRNFAAETGAPAEPSDSGKKFVVILLQAYEDNIEGMVRLGEEIARKHPELKVLYQEHPNFPVCHRVKSGLLKELPGRLRFLAPREPVDFAKTLALVTGYSTAAVPGVLHGVPLIWLRRQIDNSIYGEAYLHRIGFAADKAEEVNSILKRLIRRDPATVEACVAATAEAKAIFTPSSAQVARTLPDALAQAINDSFAEIAGPLPAPIISMGSVARGHEIAIPGSLLPERDTEDSMAAMFWSKASFKRRSAVAALAEEIQGLLKARDFPKAEEVCAQGLARYPNEGGLLSEHAGISIREGNWATALTRLERLLEVQGTGSDRDKTVLGLARVFVALGQPAEAEARIAAGLAIHPASFALRYAAAKVALLRPGGLQDPTAWRNLAATRKLRRQKDSARIPLISACVAGLRLAGFPEEAQTLLAEHFNPADEAWRKYLQDGYGRLIVFDNGNTRVEFHTKLFDASNQPVEAKRLVITFDVMTQTWAQKPYTYKALSLFDNDFLAVRKRTRQDFHQDFHREDFLRVATPVAALYRDVVAFGQSLGGYCALYYGTTLPQCRILATAPRNPQNPKYSSKRYASEELFSHEYDMPGNQTALPTIVFDPKNAEDNRYVEESLRPAFPSARFIPYPYTGHSITRYLLEAGILKSSTLGFCDGIPFPDFDRSLRAGSAEYLRNLASRNFAAGRRKWALALALRAKELGTYPERTEAILKMLGYEVPAR